jgi:hypothetical protein
MNGGLHFNRDERIDVRRNLNLRFIFFVMRHYFRVFRDS